MCVGALYVSLPISPSAIVCAVARDLCPQPCRSFQLASRGLLDVCEVGCFAQSVFGSTQPCMPVSLPVRPLKAPRTFYHAVNVARPPHSLSSPLWLLVSTDRGPHAAEDAVSAQRGGSSSAAAGRSQTRRADAVQVRRETLPRPLLRQQAQLVRNTHTHAI